MKEKTIKDFKSTTIYLNRALHEEAKIMAILCHTNLSSLIRLSIREKIDRLKKEVK